MWALTERKPRGLAPLAPQLRHELLELVDRAAAADARVDRVAAGAQPVVLRLEIEALVKVEARAIFVELGADAPPAGEDEIDLVGTRKQSAANHRDRNAIGRLLLDPVDRRAEGTRLDRHAQDHLVLYHQARDRLL